MEFVCLAVFALLIVGAVCQPFVVWLHVSRRKKAEAAYQRMLVRLRADPQNADLRRITLAVGREYCRACRTLRGVTAFVELRLRNDIEAACGGR